MRGKRLPDVAARSVGGGAAIPIVRTTRRTAAVCAHNPRHRQADHRESAAEDERLQAGDLERDAHHPDPADEHDQEEDEAENHGCLLL